MAFGWRFGDKSELVKAGGGDGTEEAVEKALGWLARHQSDDGSWSASSFASKCTGRKQCSGGAPDDFNVGISSLALLAFLGRGYTHLEAEYKDTVKKGLEWLIGQQNPLGCIGKVGQRYMYNTAIATAALSEAYGMTKEEWLEKPAKKATAYIIGAKNPERVWRYTSPNDVLPNNPFTGNDTSVTGWCFMALKSAQEAESDLELEDSYKDVLLWIKDVTDETNSYRVGYTSKGTGKVMTRGINDAWSDHDAMTSIGMFIRMCIERNKSSKAVRCGAERLMKEQNIPKWDNSGKEKLIDFYHWYYGTLAMFKYDGPNGAKWKKWNTAIKKALIPNQHIKEDGCEEGSWDPELDRWGFEAGRVYATAINVLTLEVYYRYK